MPIETEVKIKIENFNQVRKKLLELGAKKESNVFEKNTLFDNDRKTLMSSDKMLRLRKDKISRMTFKGPRQAKDLKSREEIEFEVSDINRAKALLERLGFSKSLVYEKKRETWHHRKIEIVLDEVPFGKYMEIEGNKKEIISFAKKLGFFESDFTTKTYFEIAKEKGIKGDIVFKKG